MYLCGSDCKRAQPRMGNWSQKLQVARQFFRMRFLVHLPLRNFFGHLRAHFPAESLHVFNVSHPVASEGHEALGRERHSRWPAATLMQTLLGGVARETPSRKT
jgi:hypothetical protein